MKKFFLLSFFFSFVFVACNTSITNDPNEDARKMTEQIFKAAEDNDIDACNEILGIYYEAYSKKDLADKAVFFKVVHENASSNNSDVWRDFRKSDKFKNSANNKRFQILYRETEKEAKRLGVW